MERSTINQSISIILPCYNPTANWFKTVAFHVNNLLPFVNLDEVIIVNDGSDDELNQDILALRNSLSVKVTFVNLEQNMGKGYAVREGLKVCNSAMAIYTDIDFPYKQESFLKIYSSLLTGDHKIIVGIKDDQYYKQVPKFRKVISKSLQLFIALFLKMKIKDTQCGIKGLHQDAYSIWLNGKVNRYLFDLEAIYNAERKEIAIDTVPVTLREGVQFTVIPLKLLVQEIKNLLKIN